MEVQGIIIGEEILLAANLWRCRGVSIERDSKGKVAMGKVCHINGGVMWTRG